MTDKSYKSELDALESSLREGTLSLSDKARLIEFARLIDISKIIRSGVMETIETKGDITALARYSERLGTLKNHSFLELIEKLGLDAQYGDRLNILQHYGFLDKNGQANEGDVKAPTYEEAIATFEPEELAIARCFQKPVLLIIPENSFDAKIKALKANRPNRAHWNHALSVSKLYRETDYGSDAITGWRVAIVDGADKMEVYQGDDPTLRLDERIKNRKASRKPGEKGMNRHMHALLLMQNIKNGNPITRTKSILLDDDAILSDSFVPRAHISLADSGCSISYGHNRPSDVMDYARFRSSVGGDVLI